MDSTSISTTCHYGGSVSPFGSVTLTEVKTQQSNK